MADEFYRKEMVFVRHGKGLRTYPFSFVELVNPSTNEVLGSGLMPDNDAVVNDVPVNSETDGEPQIVERLCIDPSWCHDNSRATGIVNRFG